MDGVEQRTEGDGKRREAERDRAARGLNPAAIVGAQRDLVLEALDDRDDTDADHQLENYIDLEDRILADKIEQVMPGRSDDVEDMRTRGRELLDATGTGRDRKRLRAMFDEHVRRTDGLFLALWKHLDADDNRDVAAALEEARLSREEGTTQTRPT